jgi:hypothetical protein
VGRAVQSALARGFAHTAQAVADQAERELRDLLAQGKKRGINPGVLSALSNTAQANIVIARSPAMAKAFEGVRSLTAEATADAVRSIVRCLNDLRDFSKYCRHDDLRTVLQSGDERRGIRAEALEHLATAADLFARVQDFEYAHELKSLRARFGEGIHGSREEYMAGATPERPSKRGKAAHDPQGAGVQWAVRALAGHVPSDAPKRGTAICELLALIDIEVDPNSVNTTLRRRVASKT